MKFIKKVLILFILMIAVIGKQEFCPNTCSACQNTLYYQKFRGTVNCRFSHCPDLCLSISSQWMSSTNTLYNYFKTDQINICETCFRAGHCHINDCILEKTIVHHAIEKAITGAKFHYLREDNNMFLKINKHSDDYFFNIEFVLKNLNKSYKLLSQYQILLRSSIKVKNFYKKVVNMLSKRFKLKLSDLKLNMEIDIDEEYSVEDIYHTLIALNDYLIRAKADKVHLSEDKLYISSEITKDEDVIHGLVDFNTKIRQLVLKTSDTAQVFKQNLEKNIQIINKLYNTVNKINSGLFNKEKVNVIKKKPVPSKEKVNVIKKKKSKKGNSPHKLADSKHLNKTISKEDGEDDEDDEHPNKNHNHTNANNRKENPSSSVSSPSLSSGHNSNQGPLSNNVGNNLNHAKGEAPTKHNLDHYKDKKNKNSMEDDDEEEEDEDEDNKKKKAPKNDFQANHPVKEIVHDILNKKDNKSPDKITLIPFRKAATDGSTNPPNNDLEDEDDFEETAHPTQSHHTSDPDQQNKMAFRKQSVSNPPHDFANHPLPNVNQSNFPQFSSNINFPSQHSHPTLANNLPPLSANNVLVQNSITNQLPTKEIFHHDVVKKNPLNLDDVSMRNSNVFKPDPKVDNLAKHLIGMPLKPEHHDQNKMVITPNDKLFGMNNHQRNIVSVPNKIPQNINANPQSASLANSIVQNQMIAKPQIPTPFTSNGSPLIQSQSFVPNMAQRATPVQQLPLNMNNKIPAVNPLKNLAFRKQSQDDKKGDFDDFDDDDLDDEDFDLDGFDDELKMHKQSHKLFLQKSEKIQDKKRSLFPHVSNEEFKKREINEIKSAAKSFVEKLGDELRFNAVKKREKEIKREKHNEAYVILENDIDRLDQEFNRIKNSVIMNLLNY